MVAPFVIIVLLFCRAVGSCIEQVNLANGCVLGCGSALQQGADILHYTHTSERGGGKEVNVEPHSITEIRKTLNRKTIYIFSYISMQSVFPATKQNANKYLRMEKRQILLANSGKS